MRVEEVTVIGLKFHQQLQWSKAWLAVGHSIVQPHCMLHCKGPQRDVIQPSICPMQRGVHHKSPSHVHNCLNSTLSLSILMLHSNARKGLRLPFMYALRAIFLSQENTVISMVVFDLRLTHIPKPLLKMSFPHHGLICTKWHLFCYPNEPWCSIVVNCSTLKTPICRFMPITLRQLARSPADELISGNKIAHLLLIAR